MIRNRMNIAQGAATPMILLLLMTSCAGSTKLTPEWREESYTGGPFRNVMVVAISERLDRRWAFENQLSQKLAEHGVRAVASSRVLSVSDEVSREVLEAEIDRLDLDGVLVTRLVKVRTDQEFVELEQVTPPSSYHAALYEYYVEMREETLQPGYTVDNTTVILETVLYETREKTAVWSVVSESFNPKSAEEIIQKLSDLITRQLTEQGLI